MSVPFPNAPFVHVEGLKNPSHDEGRIAEYFRDLAAGDRYFGLTPYPRCRNADADPQSARNFAPCLMCDKRDGHCVARL